MTDVINGRVRFLLARLNIKYMEIDIIRRESTGNPGAQLRIENETLTKFEIMDGLPRKDLCIPVRLYLSSLQLTPTYKNVHDKFSVKYFLSLVLVDVEDRRYFKQQEIYIWREKTE